MQNRISNKAFTLLEIMIVVIIVGVLASLALPRLSIAIERARAVEAVQELGVLRRAQMRYYDEYGHYAGNLPSWESPENYPGLLYEIPNLQYFKEVLVADCWQPDDYCVIAEMTRNDNSYHLHIQEDGQIDCSDTRPQPGNGFCKKLGFKNEFW